ncbi:hypothetical protein V6L77_25845 [Pannonibacter sp. Pt2-lr]
MSDPAAPLERVRPSRSVRFRLLAIALLPMLVIVPLVAGGIMLRWNAKFSEVLINKVSADLTIARQYLARLMETNGERLTAIAQSARFQAPPPARHWRICWRRKRPPSASTISISPIPQAR